MLINLIYNDLNFKGVFLYLTLIKTKIIIEVLNNYKRIPQKGTHIECQGIVEHLIICPIYWFPDKRAFRCHYLKYFHFSVFICICNIAKSINEKITRLRIINILYAVDVAQVASIAALCFEMGKETMTDWRAIFIAIISGIIVLNSKKLILPLSYWVIRYKGKY